jgi:FkbM family methyltransferase
MNLLKLLDASVRPGFLRAAVGWPTFSVTSFLMATSLRAQGLRPLTVIDVGANVGQFAVAMAKVFPEADVISFEPNPEAFASLERAARGLRIECVPSGVGCRPGRLDLHVNSSSGMSSFLRFSEKHRTLYPQVDDGATTSVAVTTLDDHLAGRSLAGPVLIKLDVQGFELEVLGGARRVLEAATWVVLELSFEALYDGETAFVEMLDGMSALGWSMLRPVDFLAHPNSREIVQVDALFRRQAPPAPAKNERP